MNVKIFFSNRVESVDSFSLGGLDAVFADVYVHENKLMLVSATVAKKETQYGPKPEFRKRPSISLLALPEGMSPADLYEFLDEAGDHLDLHRFDIDGETIWRASTDFDE